MKILIGGYDFEQKIHRGITFYSKALVKSLSDETIYLLTSSKNIKENAILEQNIIRQLAMYLPTNTRNLRYLNFLRNIIRISKNYLSCKFSGVHRVLKRTISFSEEKLNYLNYVDYFYNIPNFLQITAIHNKFFTERPLFFHLKEVDLFITTSPMNIKTNVPTIQTLHDVFPIKSIYHPPEDDSRIFYYRLLNALKNSEMIFSVSEYSKQKCLEIFPSFNKKIVVTYLPIPIYEEEKHLINNELSQQAILSKYNLSRDNYIFYVGMLEKRKNIKRMLEAFLAIYNKIKIPLVIAGALGYGKEEFEHYLKNERYKHKIIYLSYIENLEKLVLMKNARAFIFPSLEEGFGIPPLEAISMDTVVLVSNTGALPEVCGKAAFYVNPYSIKDIADGILEVVLNEKLRKELKASYNAILRKFSFDSFKTRVSSFIQRLY